MSAPAQPAKRQGCKLAQGFEGGAVEGHVVGGVTAALRVGA
jgi:hypothetical protein